MAVQIVLMRGINLGAANRISMTELRETLVAAGFAGVRTLGQSGNVVVGGDPEAIVAAIRARIDVACVTRTCDELAAAVGANPFPEQARTDPRHLQITFRADPGPEGLAELLEARRAGGEKVAVRGREIYSWHPDGLARSRLAQALTPPGEAVSARNWNTVARLAELAGG